MANTILTPGEENIEQTPIEETTSYLEKDNYLSEFQTEEEKAVVRENLNVYSKDSVYNRTESDTLLDRIIKEAFDQYLNMEDPHGILPTVEEMIEGVVRNDGSTPFLAPQRGVDPVQDFHLVTKRFVTKLLKEHVDAEDPHRILPEVEDMLEQYVKQSQVYFKNQLYTKNEIDQQSSQYIKKDGTTPFTKAQIGADPQIDSHLATKRYVDATIYRHLVDVDPHGFISILNKRLASYAKAANVFSKSQTYSRVQIDSIVRSLVHDAAKEAILDHLNEFDPHNILAEVRKFKFVKQDGSIPFRNPQKGVDAVDPQDLVTLHQVEEKVTETREAINNIPDPVWKPSGPVETTVGFVEDNTPMPESMTLQEICDAIFYGKGICLEVPDYVIISEPCPVTMCIHGSTGLIDRAELYQNGELIYSFQRDEFDNGCITVDSLPLFEDTEFTFKVFYLNGAIHEDTKTVKCYMPIFVGLLPKWKFANTITFDYLIELCKEDADGTQNRFLNYKEDYIAEPEEGYGKDLKAITFKYSFIDPKLRHPFVVIPEDYSDLKSISLNSQQFNLGAFDVIDQIPLQVPGVDHDIVYKIYVYRQALSRLDSEVTFNFTPRNE